MKNYISNHSSGYSKELIEPQSNSRIPITTKICLAIIFMCCALVGIMPQSIISIVVLVACVPLITTKEIYLVYPVMLFYYSQFGVLLGLSVYRLFSFIFFLFSLYHERNIRLKKAYLPPLALFTLYCIIVIVPGNLQRGLFAIFDMLCIMILITHYLTNSENLKKFFKIYAFVSLIAFFTGTQLQNELNASVMVDDQWVDVIRNLATFEDPNYMGFFYTIAIFSILALKLFNPKFRVILIIALYIIVFSTLSITTIIINALLWLLYLFVTNKINLKTIICIILILAILFGLYLYGSSNPDTPIIGMLSTRINEKLDVSSENLSDLTSGRSDVASVHMSYYMNQPIWRMFVGMNAASTLETDLDGFKYVGHNEYIDWLLNVGLIGAIVMLYFLLKRTYGAYKTYKITKDSTDLFLLISKIIWISYAFTLTVYGDLRFMLTLFL